jgi:hypothetical protein
VSRLLSEAFAGFSSGASVEYLNLLRQHDDPRRWEYPTGFDYDAATRRFAKFTEALSALLKVTLKSESGSYIQDASFHSQIYVPLDSERYTLIRFSNFGNMATVSEDEPVSEELMRAIVELLEKHGYVYVPAAVLDQPYTGENPGVTGIRTWWIRYFDWV